MAGSDLFTGSLDLLILKALSWGPRHGYAVGRWIRDTTEEEILVQEGALYPALHRLERRGLVAEEWGLTDTNREAKFYRLTAEGRRRLRDEAERWGRFARVMRLALDATAEAR
ncbi:MAG: PadR family transcriptional regulator [Gemmatimonadales bacterium]|nr:PadR family transcriptional regulator [Gemmatimonadales bacterium]